MVAKQPSGLVEDVKTADASKDKLEPVLITFQHASLNLEASPELRVELCTPSSVDGAREISEEKREDQKEKEVQRTVVCKVSNGKHNQSYMGNIQRISQYDKNFLAIRNKRTNKIQLVELSSVSLAPRVSPPESTNPLLVDDDKGEKDEAVKRTRRQELSKSFVHNFGMLKGQRLYDQAEKWTVKSENVKDNLQHAADKSHVNIEELTLPEELSSLDYLTPPINRAATKVSDVYNLHDIISEAELKSLEALANYYGQASDEDIDKLPEGKNNYSPFFKQTFKAIRSLNSMDDSEKLHYIKLLLFTECMITLSFKFDRDFRKPDFMPKDYPLLVREKILSLFTTFQGGKRMMSKIDREKLFCYVIVLGLMISNYVLDLQLLCKSIPCDLKKTTMLVKVVGGVCSMDKAKGEHHAVLNIPLAEPPRLPYSKKDKKQGKRK